MFTVVLGESFFVQLGRSCTAGIAGIAVGVATGEILWVGMDAVVVWLRVPVGGLSALMVVGHSVVSYLDL